MATVSGTEPGTQTTGAGAIRFANARRLVIKIGSSLLTSGDGDLRLDWLQALATDVAACRARGRDVILVSSGAIAVGREHLIGRDGSHRDLKLEEKQAAAAIGQIRLAHAFQEALEPHGLTLGQILLTLDDTEQRRRYLNARNTVSTLLKRGVVPLINENDTVATVEIRFGDNDRLAARVAQMASADILVILSDIDGLYTANPDTDPNATRLDDVHEITPEIEAMAGPSGSHVGSGGMITKIAAAKVATRAGCHMVIGAGAAVHALRNLIGGAPSTWFVATESPMTARKTWIAGALEPKGMLTIDDGARAALANGKSLLPAGVTSVQGIFERGDAVCVCDSAGIEIGRGLTAYSTSDARRILGHKTREIEPLLGYRGRDEMVHRDDLALNVTSTRRR